MGYYTIEFYNLLVYKEIQETEDQLVSWYICSLSIAIQDTINPFIPIKVSVVHQRALLVEKQLDYGSGSRSNNGVSFGSGGGSSSSN